MGEYDFPIVGVGASAGGLEALEKLFGNLKSDTGMAFVVVQHLSPDYKSLMVELLSKYTEMPVKRAEDDMKIEKNRVYLIPPKKNMTIEKCTLFLSDQVHHSGLNLPIDIFFRSLADDVGERAVGIILSGTGSDGTLGIRAIKGAGGVVIIQDERTAKFDGMPRSAIATGMVDLILPPDKIGEQLLKYSKLPLIFKENSENQNLKNDDFYAKIINLIRNTTGVDFTYYKPNTIVRRIERRINIHQVMSVKDYFEILKNNINEIRVLHKELLIGVTKFFRDTDAFDVIEKKVIPTLLSKGKKDESVRLWVVGCSTGEEAYSLAILLQEYMDQKNIKLDIKVFATDIDKESIEYASAGIYPESIAADVSQERLNDFFIKSGSTYKVCENIRKLVIFATHNIIKDPPFSKIDFISCRNLLIYFEPVMQKRVISSFSFSLNKGGFLFLGSSESLGDLADSFTTFNIKWKIYNNLISEKRVPLEHYKLMYENFPKRRQTPVSQNETLAPEHFQNRVADNLFEDYVPPSVIIDEKYNIVHVFNDINIFLKIPKGKINLNLMNMIPDDLSVPISTATHKSFKNKCETNYSEITLRVDDKIYTIDLKVKPLNNDKFSDNYLLIIFQEIKKEEYSENIKYEHNSDKSVRVDDLEQELKYTKENLQATIEELETSNEELQATNEELIASNEELQSTNEELQSVNEELYTVNSEYQQKIEELTELNNDINNWFKTSDISTIFLDLNLRVRKFTPEINRYVNLIQADIGRPFNHISYKFQYEEFFDKVESVIKELKIVTEELELNNGRWISLKILPYRTSENSVKGVVITFIDITDIKNKDKEIIREHDLLKRVLENNPIANVVVTVDGRISFVNKAAEILFGMNRKEMSKLYFNSSEWDVYNKNGEIIPDHKRPFYLIKEQGMQFSKMIEYRKNVNGELEGLSISGSPIFDELKNVIGAVFAIEKLDEAN